MFAKAFVAFVALAASVNAVCMHATRHLPRQEAEPVPISDFSYTGLTGPTNWAGIKAENAGCATNTVQSPINIDATIAKAAEVPQVVIASVAEADFENLGTTLETIVTGNTTLGGTTFELKQFHMHSPSEHRVNEEYFPLEVHMVHEGPNGEIAVIALLFQLSEDGSTTDLLTNVIQNIDQVVTPGTRTKTGALDFSAVINHVSTTPLFQYTGSLTTPPCAEGLTFLVTEVPLPLNVATFNKIKNVIKFNARFTQNTLGQTNLLQVAADFAIQRDGLNVAGGAAAANGTAAADAGNIEAIVKAIVDQKQDLTFETVTTTVTNVKVAGAVVSGAEAGAGGQAGNGQVVVPQVGHGAAAEPKKDDKKENKKEAKQENKPEAKQEIKPAAKQENTEEVHRVKIERSRIGRSPSFRRRSAAGKRRL